MKDWLHEDIKLDRILSLFDKIVNEYDLLTKNHQLSYKIINNKTDVKLTKRDKTVFINIYKDEFIRVYINGNGHRNVLIAEIDVKYGERLINKLNEEEQKKDKILTELLADFGNSW